MRQWLLYMFLIVSSGVSLHNCIEVITSERNERPQPDAHFLIPGLNLSSLDTFTMCGRFMIYQFTVADNVFSGQNGMMERVQGIFPSFATISKVACKENDFFCNIEAVAEYDNNKFKYDKELVKNLFLLEATSFFGESKIFPSYLNPNTWNTFCIKANRTMSIFKLNKHSRTNNNHELWPTAYHMVENYFFMNVNFYGQMISPMTGAFTDVNVWDRMLSEEEEDDWMNCRFQNFEKEGNVISWHNSSKHVKLTGLQKVNDSIETICPRIFRHLTISDDYFHFMETLNYCNKIGNMAEISNNERAQEVNKTWTPSPWFDWNVFTGYTDIKDEGDWVVHNTDKKLAWDNWAYDSWGQEPNNWGGDEDCMQISMKNFKLYDVPCMTNYWAVCNVAEVISTF